MGTKIDYKTYFSENKKMRDLDEGTGNSWHPYFARNTLNEHFYNSFVQSHLSMYSGFHKEVLKQTILEHEAIFRKQVYELHRLYSIQKVMMEKYKKNSLSKFLTSEVASKNISCSSQVTRKLLEMSHLPARNNSLKMGEGRVADENLSSISFYESSLQLSSASPEIHASQGAHELDSCIKRCPDRVFDLHLPADIYINGEDTQRLDKDVKVKLPIDNVNSCNVRNVVHESDFHCKNILFNCLADLSQSQKETSLEEETGTFPVQLIQPKTRFYENHSHNSSFRSSDLTLRSAFFQDGDSYGNASSNVLLAVEEDISRGRPSSNNESGQFSLNPVSGKETHSMSFEPIHLKATRAQDINLTDHNEAASRFRHVQGDPFQFSGKNLIRSVSDNSSFSVANKLEIDMTMLPQVSTWKMSSGSENHAEDPTVRSFSHLCGFNNEFQADSHSTVINLSYSDMNLNVEGEICFSGTRVGLPAQQNKATSEIFHTCDSMDNIKFSSLVDSGLIMIDRSNRSKVEKGTSSFEFLPSGSDSYQEKMVVNELKPESLLNNINLDSFEKPVCVEKNRSNLQSYIDLNSEISVMEDHESYETSTKGLVFKSSHSDSFSVSKAVPLIDLKAPAMALDEDITPQIESTGSCKIDEMLIKEAAENMIKLSMATKPSENSLHLFADMILSNTDIVNLNQGFDLFELMTLQLEEMKPEKPWHRAFEQEDPHEASPLLARRRRRQAGKRRQMKDFQKDILPGLGKLSRQEAIEDLEAIGELVKASGRPWEVGMARRKTGRNRMKVLARRRRRPTSATIAARFLMSNGNFNHTVFELSRGCMIQWGRRTRRCRSRRRSPMNISATLL